MIKGKNMPFDVFSIIISSLIIFISIYPFYYILVLSLNEGMDTRMGGVYFWPRAFTLENYTQILNDAKWLNGLLISVLRATIGTVISVFFTSIFAYAISPSWLRFRKFYRGWLIVAMYVSGGLIPTYMVFTAIKITNSFLIYIVPSALDYFFVLIFLTYYRTIPPSLREATLIDGASESRVFFDVILRISTPILATYALFSAVTQWNSYFDAVIYVHRQELRPLAYLLVEVLNRSNTSQFSPYGNAASFTTQSLQMACVIIAIAPIVALYPFLQKYFSKGIMLGAVKE
ncbi:MAG: carbohydrate ABC transporter permease [Oscillospiraceae bacterium]|nr:carbohydrate ABC transporter permease [Oscillospiraceae bacterium]